MINITQYLCIHFYIQSIFRYNKYMFINYFKKKIIGYILDTVRKYEPLYNIIWYSDSKVQRT